MVHNLSEKDSILHEYMEALRNVDKQTDRAVFRQNLKNVGRYIGFAMSGTMSYVTTRIETPLAPCDQRVLSDDMVVITILRAGLPLHEGLLDVFPKAENGFISAYRKHDGDDFTIEVEYVACPDLTDKVVVINDPMLASGQSFINAWEALLEYGKPRKIVLAAVIAAAEGVEYVSANAPGEFDLWVGAIDPELSPRKYIVPGLGDAGDLAFGHKIQH